ncbi:hypothetical protein PSQ19_16370 [Devosia algicola]|uniref:Pyrrolo-quinoline quinone repeat domain-containing protein n=1 Tax=Devosia algicola TaxID=3026418 RepID=A0ABY7YM03_9HYPH|nr:hypothetical protein [Devosia algicola]WDR02203.1 hypothetical protein PSQ19_16370 [Devosia algicola]
MSDSSSRQKHPIAFWTTAIVGAVLITIGIVLVGGGIWLASLGGSWYYLFAGIGLLLAGALFVAGRMLGLYIYGITYLLTCIWAVWEVGLDWWAQVPRLVAPTLLLALALACIPALRRRSYPTSHRSRDDVLAQGRQAAVAIIVVGLTVAGLPFDGTMRAQAQDNPAAATQPDAALGKPQAAPETFPDGAAAKPTLSENSKQAAISASPARPAETIAMAGDDWPAYGGSTLADRYSPLDQINVENVGKLEKRWEFRTGDMPNEKTKGKYSPETTPIKIGNTIYMCSATNELIALDAATGLERWSLRPSGT